MPYMHTATLLLVDRCIDTMLKSKSTPTESHTARLEQKLREMPEEPFNVIKHNTVQIYDRIVSNESGNTTGFGGLDLKVDSFASYLLEEIKKDQEITIRGEMGWMEHNQAFAASYFFIWLIWNASTNEKWAENAFKDPDVRVYVYVERNFDFLVLYHQIKKISGERGQGESLRKSVQQNTVSAASTSRVHKEEEPGDWYNY